MAFYDEERILDDADALSVAEYLGLEIRRAGSRHQIYCPGHLARLGKADSKMGSCYLTPKGYHCYACDKTVSLPNMVMEVEECSYKEALGIIADSLGGRDLYTVSGKREAEEEHEKILSEKDLKIIGLHSTVSFDVVIGSYPSKAEILELNEKNKESEDEEIKKMTLSPKVDCSVYEDDVVYLAVHHQTVSLKSMLQESPISYYQLVRGKAKEYMEKYKTWMDNIEKPGTREYKMLEKFASSAKQKFDNKLIFDFRNIINEWYSKAKEIYLSIPPGMAGDDDDEEVPELKVKEKIRLDLFSDIP